MRRRPARDGRSCPMWRLEMGEVARCGGSRWAKLPDVAARDGRSCPMWTWVCGGARLEMGEVARCGGSRWAKLPDVLASVLRLPPLQLA
eukprot:gene15032-biopygen9686